MPKQNRLVRQRLLCDNARMIILLSNDDGIQSEGLTALEESLRSVADIFTVALDRARVRRTSPRDKQRVDDVPTTDAAK